LNLFREKTYLPRVARTVATYQNATFKKTPLAVREKERGKTISELVQLLREEEKPA